MKLDMFPSFQIYDVEVVNSVDISCKATKKPSYQYLKKIVLRGGSQCNFALLSKACLSFAI